MHHARDQQRGEKHQHRHRHTEVGQPEAQPRLLRDASIEARPHGRHISRCGGQVAERELYGVAHAALHLLGHRQAVGAKRTACRMDFDSGAGLLGQQVIYVGFFEVVYLGAIHCL